MMLPPDCTPMPSSPFVAASVASTPTATRDTMPTCHTCRLRMSTLRGRRIDISYDGFSSARTRPRNSSQMRPRAQRDPRVRDLSGAPNLLRRATTVGAPLLRRVETALEGVEQVPYVAAVFRLQHWTADVFPGGRGCVTAFRRDKELVGVPKRSSIGAAPQERAGPLAGSGRRAL